MFEDYTNEQLIELHRVCSEMVDRAPTAHAAADALLIVEEIERVLEIREQSHEERKSA